MERLPLRRLLAGPPAPGRILSYNLWFRGHNNPRYAELLPRLDRLDRYAFLVADRQPLRALQYRALRWSAGPRDRFVLERASSRYAHMLATDTAHIAHFRGGVVADVDDPKLTAREAELLNRPTVRAYVVTAERAARRLEELGVEKPWHVIPQGVSLRDLSAERAAEVAARLKPDGTLVVGHMAAWLLSDGDRGSESALYNADHLLDVWGEIHRRVPEARLWLLGTAAANLRRRVAGREDVRLFGRVPRSELLAHVANFDVALYARAEDQGIRAAKVTEYMGCGVPTVSYDYDVTRELAETGAGVLAPTTADFVEAVERLLHDDEERRRVAERARRAGEERDWDRLGARYARLLDEHLPEERP